MSVRTQSGFHEDGAWKIAFLHFAADATVEDMNAALSKRPGWEPWGRDRFEDGSVVIWVKRKVDE